LIYYNSSEEQQKEIEKIGVPIALQCQIDLANGTVQKISKNALDFHKKEPKNLWQVQVYREKENRLNQGYLIIRIEVWRVLKTRYLLIDLII